MRSGAAHRQFLEPCQRHISSGYLFVTQYIHAAALGYPQLSFFKCSLMLRMCFILNSISQGFHSNNSLFVSSLRKIRANSRAADEWADAAREDVHGTTISCAINAYVTSTCDTHLIKHKRDLITHMLYNLYHL